MTIPMIILSIGSAFGGMLLLFVGNIEHWLEPVVGFAEAEHAPSNTILLPVTLAVVLVGAWIGFRKYALQAVPVEAPANVSVLTKAARADLYGDAFNEAVLMRPGQWLTRTLVYVDRKVVDGAVNGTAGLIGVLGAALRTVQNGYARSYALTMLIGVTIVTAIAMLVRMS